MGTKNEGTLPAISEAEWQSKVIDAAHLYGWAVAHFRRSKTQRADGSVFHQTAVGADGKGFVDLVLVHPVGGVLFVELKAQKGRLSPEQVEWSNRLSRAGAKWHCWKPSQWKHVVDVLSGPRP
jgi:hypothetical protein